MNILNNIIQFDVTTLLQTQRNLKQGKNMLKVGFVDWALDLCLNHDTPALARLKGSHLLLKPFKQMAHFLNSAKDFW